MPLTVKHAKSDTIADFTGTITGYNSAGASTTIVATDLVRPSDWNSNHSLTLSLTGSEIASLFNFGSGLTSSTDASGVTVGFQSVEAFEPFPLHNTNSNISAPAIGSWYVDPVFNTPFQLQQGVIRNFVQCAAGFLGGRVYSSASTGSASRVQSLSNNIAFYRRGNGANSTRLETFFTNCWEARATHQVSVSSTTAGGGTTTGVIITSSLALSFPVSINSTGGYTYSSTSSSATTSTSVSTGASTLADNLLTNIAAFLSGSRIDMWGLSTTLIPDAYWVAHMFSSNSSSSGATYTGGTMFSTQSRLGLLENSLQGFKSMGLSVSQTTTTPFNFHGALLTTTSAASSVMAIADIRYTTGRMYWHWGCLSVP